MLQGIVLADDLPFRLECDVRLKRGQGEIMIAACVADPNTIEEIVNNAIGFADEIIGLEERPFPDLSSHDLLIRLSTPGLGTPIFGPSYGLLLSLGIIFALNRTAPTITACVTGEVNGSGEVLDVGDISKKRRGAVVLGFDKLMLPTSQVDFFSSEVVQIPVATIFEAYTVSAYGKT